MFERIRRRVTRNVVPRAAMATLDTRLPTRLREGARRVVGLRPTGELFVAFEDPCSALALRQIPDLLTEHECKIDLFPVVDHGIPNDPEAESAPPTP